MATKDELLKTIELCREALESCGDNFGTEACDNGFYEKHFDDKLVEKALNKIREMK